MEEPHRIILAILLVIPCRLSCTRIIALCTKLKPLLSFSQSRRSVSSRDELSDGGGGDSYPDNQFQREVLPRSVPSFPQPATAFQCDRAKNAIKDSMLLTSAQISTALSSGIVCMFTSLLFYSGYALQQRTVREIHVALHPKIAPPSAENETVIPFIPDRKQQILTTYGSSETNWKRVAYARTVWQHSEVCEAVMLFAELTSRKSKAQKVLLYPEEWKTAAGNPHSGNRALETSMRLLQKASQAYRVSLVPIKDTYGYGGGDRWTDELSNYLALTSFERVIYLPPKGFVLDAEILDSLFAAPISESITPLDGAHAKPNQALLIEPSLSVSKRASIARENMGEPVLTSDHLASIMLQTSYLRQVPDSVNIKLDADTFYESTAYIRFTDPEIAGPEFNLEKGTFSRTQPNDDDLQVIWRNAYDHFRLGRMNYCGLDLQPILKETINDELK